MSYKDKIEIEIEAIINKNMEIEQRVLDKLGSFYKNAIMESKKAGISIDSISYEILEGVEKSLSSLDSNLREELIIKVAKSMIDIVQYEAEKNIFKYKKTAILIRERFMDILEGEKSELFSLLEICKNYSQDRNLKNLENKLLLTKKELNRWAEDINYN